MDTRWKNLIKDTIEPYWRGVLGALLMVVAGFIVFILIMFRSEQPTDSLIFWGIAANIMFSLGVKLWFSECLADWYQSWSEQAEDFYAEGSKRWKQMRKIIREIGALALIGACCFFSSILDSRMWYDQGQYTDYEVGYILILAVILQYGVCQSVLNDFMKNKLDLYMEQLTENNQKKLDLALEKAVEIERQSMEKVSRSDKLRVDLITNVSHDLKTPLTSMVGYIELMKKEELNDVARDYVEVISDKAQKLKEMIESLFSLAKVSSGNVELRKESLELNRLVEQIFVDMEDKVKVSGLQFVMKLTETNTTMVTDNMHLYRICQNLMENALKYSAEGTRVFVKTGVEDNGNLSLEITNTANYFMDFDKADIIERFSRADQARTSEGNGLGLAIVSTYTNALGGEFDIHIDCDQFKVRLEFPALEKTEG